MSPRRGGQGLALLLWAAAAFKCAARDTWIGWHPAVQWQRLHLVANNVRFLVLPGGRCRTWRPACLGFQCDGFRGTGS